MNLVGMEGGLGFDPTYGPVAGTHYPVFSTRVVDYLRSKGVSVLRLLFSWERLQDRLYGPLPASAPGAGGYRAYLAYLKRIVDYATSLGMYVVLEPWQVGADGGAGGASWRGQPLDPLAFADLWGKLARVFAPNPRVQYGLVNEPHGMSTMLWFGTAQRCIDAIRAAGARTTLYVPGNGWTGAGSWTEAWYDAATPQRSNAYGWQNTNGPGRPLSDPLHDLLAEVHVYADADAGGGTTGIVSPTILVDRLRVTVDAARAAGYKVFVGEVGLYAGAPGAYACWRNFIDYVNANADVVAGFAFWAAGEPGWWDDVAASGGGHFSVTPTVQASPQGGISLGDTVNMRMIAGSF